MSTTAPNELASHLHCYHEILA